MSANVQELKAAGNDQFRAGHYLEAAEKYSAALNAQAADDPDTKTRTALYSNRESCCAQR